MEPRGRSDGALMHSLRAAHTNAQFNPSAPRGGPPPAAMKQPGARPGIPAVPPPSMGGTASRGFQPPPRFTPSPAAVHPAARPPPAYAHAPPAPPSRPAPFPVPGRPPPIRPGGTPAASSAFDTSQDALRLRQDAPSTITRASTAPAENAAILELLQDLPPDVFDFDLPPPPPAAAAAVAAGAPSTGAVAAASSEDAQVIALKQQLTSWMEKCRTKEAEATFLRHKMEALNGEKRELVDRVAAVTREERALRVAEQNKLEAKIREMEMNTMLQENLKRPQPESDKRAADVTLITREKEAAEKREQALRAEKDALQRQMHALLQKQHAQQQALGTSAQPVVSTSLASALMSTVTTSAVTLGGASSATSTPVSASTPSIPRDAPPIDLVAAGEAAARAAVLGPGVDCFYYLIGRGASSRVWRLAAHAMCDTVPPELWAVLLRVGAGTSDHVYTLLSQLLQLRDGDDTQPMPRQRGAAPPSAHGAESPLLRVRALAPPPAPSHVVTSTAAPGALVTSNSLRGLPVAPITSALSPGILRQRRALFGGYTETTSAVTQFRISSALADIVHESGADNTRASAMERHLLAAAAGGSITPLLDSCADVLTQRADAAVDASLTPSLAAAALLHAVLLAHPTAAYQPDKDTNVSHDSVAHVTQDDVARVTAPDAVLAVLRRRVEGTAHATTLDQSKRPHTLDALLHAATACSTHLRGANDRADMSIDVGPLLLRRALVAGCQVATATQCHTHMSIDVLLHCLRGVVQDCSYWSAGLVPAAACLHMPAHEQLAYIQARVLGALILPGPAGAPSFSRRASLREDAPTMTAMPATAGVVATPRATLIASGGIAGNAAVAQIVAAHAQQQHAAALLLHRTLLSLHSLQDSVTLLSSLEPVLLAALVVPTDAMLLASGAASRQLLEATLARTACCRVLASFSDILASTSIEFMAPALLAPLPVVRAEDIDWSSGADAATRHIAALTEQMQQSFAARIVQLQVATQAARLQTSILRMIASVVSASGVRGVGILFGGCNIRVPAAALAAAQAGATAQEDAEDDGLAPPASGKRARVVVVQGDSSNGRKDAAQVVPSTTFSMSAQELDASAFRAGKRTNRSGVASALPVPKPSPVVPTKGAAATASASSTGADAADGDVFMNLQVSEPNNSALLPRIVLVAVARVHETCRLRAALLTWPSPTSDLETTARAALEVYADATAAAATAGLTILRCYPKLLDVLRAHVELLGDKPHLRSATGALVNMCASIVHDMHATYLHLEQPHLLNWCASTATQALAADAASARAAAAAAVAAQQQHAPVVQQTAGAAVVSPAAGGVAAASAVASVRPSTLGASASARAAASVVVAKRK